MKIFFKKALPIILLIILFNIWLWFYLPQLSEEDLIIVNGTCVDVFESSGKYGATYLLLDNGEAYVYNDFGYLGFATQFVGKNVSFAVSDKTRMAIVAWNESAESLKNTLEIRNKNAIVSNIIMAIVSLLAAPLLLLKPIVLAINEYHEKIEKRDAKERKEKKKAKKQDQSKKLENIENPTQYRHQQNKNISKKKQKRKNSLPETRKKQ